jgi:hypothetical protein
VAKYLRGLSGSSHPRILETLRHRNCDALAVWAEENLSDIGIVCLPLSDRKEAGLALAFIAYLPDIAFALRHVLKNLRRVAELHRVLPCYFRLSEATRLRRGLLNGLECHRPASAKATSQSLGDEEEEMTHELMSA